MEEELDVFSRVYVKFYICQIYASETYTIWKQNQKNLEKLLELPSDNENNPNEIVPVSQETEKYMKRLFVYKKKIFSRVEVMGIVTLVQSHMNGDVSRILLHLDDSTGIILCILWKNKLERIFNVSEEELVPGTFLRVLGQVDFFGKKFEISVERYQIIKSFLPEYLFHLTLKNNLAAIEKADVTTNVKKEITQSIAPMPLEKENVFIARRSTNSCQIAKDRDHNILKDFANRLLAFFQNYKIDCAIEDDEGYIRVKVKELRAIQKVNEIINDFKTHYSYKEKCFQDVFIKFFEPNFFGKVFYSKDSLNFDDAEVEIKIDQTKIQNDIKDFIKKKTEEDSTKGAFISEIQTHLNSIYNGFFTNDYIKFMLKNLSESGAICTLNPNSFIIE